jgi:hypothetical protein
MVAMVLAVLAIVVTVFVQMFPEPFHRLGRRTSDFIYRRPLRKRLEHRRRELEQISAKDYLQEMTRRARGLGWVVLFLTTLGLAGEHWPLPFNDAGRMNREICVFLDFVFAAMFSMIGLAAAMQSPSTVKNSKDRLKSEIQTLESKLKQAPILPGGASSEGGASANP